MSLKNKRILITAGPTWVPIDAVRVISNIATGQTGILLAEKLRRIGAKVVLLLGPMETCCLNPVRDKTPKVPASPLARISNGIKLLRFRFFDELKDKIIQELKDKRYDIVIHSAAVSDYRPLRADKQKIKSGIKNLILNLAPTIKIIDLIKKISPDIFLVGFKFEAEADKKLLIRKAIELIRRSKPDLVVANSITQGKYKAYIIKNPAPLHLRGEMRLSPPARWTGPFLNKNTLCANLLLHLRLENTPLDANGFKEKIYGRNKIRGQM